MAPCNASSAVRSSNFQIIASLTVAPRTRRPRARAGIPCLSSRLGLAMPRSARLRRSQQAHGGEFFRKQPILHVSGGGSDVPEHRVDDLIVAGMNPRPARVLAVVEPVDAPVDCRFDEFAGKIG